jgi:hypothetical protein
VSPSGRTASRDLQPSTRLTGRATQEKDNHKPAAERSKRRARKFPDRRMATRRKVADILQDAGVHANAANNPYAAPARPVTRYRDRCRPGIGYKMLKWGGDDGSHHLHRRKQRQGGECLPRQQRQGGEEKEQHQVRTRSDVMRRAARIG